MAAAAAPVLPVGLSPPLPGSSSSDPRSGVGPATARARPTPLGQHLALLNYHMANVIGQLQQQPPPP